MPCLWPFVLFAVRSLKSYSTAAAPLLLRPYQEACLEACVDALRRGSTRVGVSLPTGAGKTTVFISLLARLSAHIQAPNATRSLVIVNSVELAQQTANQARRLFPDWSVEIEQGKHHASGQADLYVAIAVFANCISSFRRQHRGHLADIVAVPTSGEVCTTEPKSIDHRRGSPCSGPFVSMTSSASGLH